ncbi:MAG: septum formation protein Maf [Clostridia bacterium]|nr:septum formation protein Maf [Clostridia bacterium]
MNIPEIILASASARRREILTHLGLEPRILVSDADETVDRVLTPELFTEELSLRKAQAVMPLIKRDQLLIASDTVVAKGDTIFGKPHSEKEAFDMLSALSGSTHKVVSGVALSLNGQTSVTHDVTLVTFRELSKTEILRYVESGEPFDKAGGYGIQDTASVFIEKIDGEYFNVVGLPVYKMFSVLKSDFGLDYFTLKLGCKARKKD